MLQVDLETFFSQAPKPNPDRVKVTGSICGTKVESLEGTMREIRILDKLVDDLAKGLPLGKITHGSC